MKIKSVRMYQTVYVTPQKSEQKHFYLGDKRNVGLTMDDHIQGVLFTFPHTDSETGESLKMITLVPFTNIASIVYEDQEDKKSKKKG